MQFSQFSYWKCLFAFFLLQFSTHELSGQLDTGYVKLKPTLENFELIMSLENPTIGQIESINRLSYQYIFRNTDT